MNGRSKMLVTKSFITLSVFLVVSRAIADEPPKTDDPQTESALVETARERGLDWLTKNQVPDGSWGQTYTIAVTSFACLSYLGCSDDFLLQITPAAISQGQFPDYGHFYGCMGMHLLRQEFGGDEAYREQTSQYILASQQDVLSWQQEDGAWPAKAWIASSEEAAYGTAFATLVLSVPESRLSIYNRRPPKLP